MGRKYINGTIKVSHQDELIIVAISFKDGLSAMAGLTPENAKALAADLEKAADFSMVKKAKRLPPGGSA